MRKWLEPEKAEYDERRVSRPVPRQRRTDVHDRRLQHGLDRDSPEVDLVGPPPGVEPDGRRSAGELPPKVAA